MNMRQKSRLLQPTVNLHNSAGSLPRMPEKGENPGHMTQNKSTINFNYIWPSHKIETENEIFGPHITEWSKEKMKKVKRRIQGCNP